MRLSLVALPFVLSFASRCCSQMIAQAGMTADAHCGKGYCFTVVYNPQQSLVNYTLVVPKGGADIGWYAVAQGTQMKGANMAINWVNSDGSLTTSHRSAAGEEYPVESLANSLPSLSVNEGITPSTTLQTIWSWSFTQSTPPSSSMAHIFASSSISPKGKEPSSGIPMHDHYEYPITLDMDKAYDGSAPAGLAIQGTTTMQPSSSSGTSTRHRDLSQNKTRLFFAHMMLMVISWMLILPLGVFVARFGRNSSTWFPFHRAVQTFATLLILIGAILAIVAISGDHFSSSHAKSGLIVCLLFIVQVLLGGAAHYLRGKTGKRYIGYIHMPLGIILIAASVYTIHLGFDIWKWEAPKGASYFIYAWAGFLLFVYIAGFALSSKGENKDQ